eukprot:TRINITY_DN10205_c0_g1_i4.p1 TRINITY_DN10205_c0_g1~~TRINITY_DN10205_c0_g1_i4.p1  ORF type:complete len:752 (+),score=199.05 TRINITY_DN10205_c0_g1_i4:249-2504(+)
MSGPSVVPPVASDDGGNSGSTRLTGWLLSKAATLEGHVKEIHKNTKQIAQDVKGNVAKGIAGGSNRRFSEERFDVTFVERALGLELDLEKGAVVRLVKPGGQAERLSVREQDRLVAIAGKLIPEVPDDVGSKMDDFIEAVKTRMSYLPRPVTLTFARVVPVEATIVAEDDADVMGAVKQRMQKMPLPLGFSRNDENGGVNGLDGGSHVNTGGEAPVASVAVGGNQAPLLGVAELLAQLAAAQEAVQRYECDAALAREDADKMFSEAQEAMKLRADLADIQLTKAWSVEEAKDYEEEVESERARTEEATSEVLRLSAELESVVERTRFDAQEQSERRTAVLGEELDEKLAAMRGEMIEESESCRASVRLHEAHVVVAEERCSEAQSKEASGASRLSHLEVEVVEAREQAAEASSELTDWNDDRRRRDLAVTASERLAGELRREVERLRVEVKRQETAAETANANLAAVTGSSSGSAALLTRDLEAELAEANNAAGAAEAQATKLAEELAWVKGRLEREQAAGVAASREFSKLRAEKDLGATATREAASLELQEPEATVLGRVQCGGDDVESRGEDLPLLHDGDNGGSQQSSADLTVAEFKVRIAALEVQNAKLTRSLGARPIVYQYGPMPGDDVGSAGDDDEDDEQAPAANPTGDQLNFGVKALLLLRGFFLISRRRTFRVLSKCRKTSPAIAVEKSLRSFTKQLLTRPFMLWLFYIHLVVLWIMAIWRSRTSSLNNADLESMEFKAARTHE